jgi:hypothetical protein
MGVGLTAGRPVCNGEIAPEGDCGNRAVVTGDQMPDANDGKN